MSQIQQIDPFVRFFWEGEWSSGRIEPLRQLFDCLLVFVSQGEFDLILEGENHKMRAGSVAVIPPGVWHESRVPEGCYTHRHCFHFDWLRNTKSLEWIPISAYWMDAYPRKYLRKPPGWVLEHLPLISHGNRRNELYYYLDFLAIQFREEQTNAMMAMWPVLKILTQNEAQSVSTKRGKTERAIEAIRSHIDTYYAESQDLSTYEELTGLSRSHLCHSFSKRLGKSPIQYLKDLRLLHAQRLLSEYSLNVSEVARCVGFSDPNYFSRAFKQRFGCSPTEMTNS